VEGAEEKASPLSRSRIFFSLEARSIPHLLLLMGRNEVYNCLYPHEFATFHAKRDPPHIPLCLQDETRFIYVLSNKSKTRMYFFGSMYI